MPDWTVGVGHALDLLHRLPENKLHCCVTSPPYYKLRDYGTPPVLWGGDPKCEHDFGEPASPRCWHCDAWRGELGQETTPEQYVAHLTQLFHEVKRVLHPRGTLWVNLGDSHAGSNGNSSVPSGYKQKDLIPVSWMLGQALREDGWYLRSQIIWHKPNVLPNSYKDRPVDDYEPVLLLSKSEEYYYDYFAGLQRGVDGAGHRGLRTTWSLPTRSSGYPHYACFPPLLPARCIALGCPAQTCALCGAPYTRDVVTTRPTTNAKEALAQRVRTRGAINGGKTGVTLGHTGAITREFTGWSPSCTCDADPVPGVVLDPFGGIMTAGVAALALHRRFIGLEANPLYATEGRRRLDDATASSSALTRSEAVA